MLIYEIEIEEGREQEVKKALAELSFVKSITEHAPDNDLSFASQKSLEEDWNSESDDELQKLYKL
jgi:hypothetical protein